MFDSDEEYYELYTQFFAEQEGRCKICQLEWEEGMIRFHMDHCHKTLVKRGLLCFSCNSKLGWFEKYRAEIEEYLKC